MDDSTLIVPVWSNGQCRTDVVDQFLNWSEENSMIRNHSKCEEIIFRMKGFIQDIAQVKELSSMGRHLGLSPYHP